MQGTENLAELVETEVQGNVEETPAIEASTAITVDIIPQAEYFDKYSTQIEALGYLRFGNEHLPEGIDADVSNILYSEIVAGKANTHRIPEVGKAKALDLEPIAFDIYKNGVCRFTHCSSPLVEGDTQNPLFFVQAYFTHSNLIYYDCLKVQDGDSSFYVPFNKTQLKKEEVAIINPTDIDSLVEKLTAPCDLEAIQLLYSPLMKYKDKESLTTNMEVISWMAEIYKNVIDPVHQMLINDTILSIVQS